MASNILEEIKQEIKKKLPEEFEERIYEVAKDYVATLKDISDALISDPWDEEEAFEIGELVINAYAQALEMAMEELDE